MATIIKDLGGNTMHLVPVWHHAVCCPMSMHLQSMTYLKGDKPLRGSDVL